jgi:hypothetical protein
MSDSTVTIARDAIHRILAAAHAYYDGRQTYADAVTVIQRECQAAASEARSRPQDDSRQWEQWVGVHGHHGTLTTLTKREWTQTSYIACQCGATFWAPPPSAASPQQTDQS